MKSLGRKLEFLAHARQIGPRTFLSAAAAELWGAKSYFGLRCDLTNLPPLRPAKLETRMEARDPGAFTGFEDELRRVSGPDHVEALLRVWMCRNGLETLYAALSPEASAIYTQWLVRPATQHLLHAHAPGRFPVLQSGEVLLEGAYTFSGFRGVGAMGNGMGQLLRIGADEGAQSAITYVAADNVPSLRGCAKVGFVLDHVRRRETRLGRFGTMIGPPDDAAMEMWHVAVGERPQPG
jgi:hypothetical protein